MKEIAQARCSKANKTKVNVSRNVMVAAEFDPHSQKTTTIVVSRLYGILYYYQTPTVYTKLGKGWIIMDSHF